MKTISHLYDVITNYVNERNERTQESNRMIEEAVLKITKCLSSKVMVRRADLKLLLQFPLREKSVGIPTIDYKMRCGRDAMYLCMTVMHHITVITRHFHFLPKRLTPTRLMSWNAHESTFSFGNRSFHIIIILIEFWVLETRKHNRDDSTITNY